MTTKQKLVSAVTQYDAKQSKRAGFNRYALPQYLARIDEVDADIQQGANVRDAITAAFTGRLMDVCLKAVGENTSTRDDQRCKGAWHYIPASDRLDAISGARPMTVKPFGIGSRVRCNSGFAWAFEGQTGTITASRECPLDGTLWTVTFDTPTAPATNWEPCKTLAATQSCYELIN